MWHTSLGDRTLDGDEANLVSAGVRVLIDALVMEFDENWQEDDTGSYPTGVELFDRMTPAQRVGALHSVASALLSDIDAPTNVSAIEEATVAALFMEIRDQVAIEIDFRGDGENDGPDHEAQNRWRSLVLAAQLQLREREFDGGAVPLDDDDFLPSASVDCREIKTWDAIIEDLVDGILWDRDFEMANLFLDADPNTASRRRKLLGIGQDYFSDVADDPLPAQVARMIAETREMTQRKPR